MEPGSDDASGRDPHQRGAEAEGSSFREMLIAVAILSILSATLSPLVLGYVKNGRRAQAASDAQLIARAIREYRRDTGVWPAPGARKIDTPGALSALVERGAGSGADRWQGPYLETVPIDPWGNPYVCRVREARRAARRGGSWQRADQAAVLCVSAGPNQQYDTPMDDASALAREPAGDDVGFLAQGGS